MRVTKPRFKQLLIPCQYKFIEMMWIWNMMSQVIIHGENNTDLVTAGFQTDRKWLDRKKKIRVRSSSSIKGLWGFNFLWLHFWRNKLPWISVLKIFVAQYKHNFKNILKSKSRMRKGKDYLSSLYKINCIFFLLQFKIVLQIPSKQETESSLILWLICPYTTDSMQNRPILSLKFWTEPS